MSRFVENWLFFCFFFLFSLFIFFFFFFLFFFADRKKEIRQVYTSPRIGVSALTCFPNCSYTRDNSKYNLAIEQSNTQNDVWMQEHRDTNRARVLDQLQRCE